MNSRNYDDMLYMPHHDSAVHPRMPAADRAAQFAPFAALTGFGARVRESARHTEQRPEPDEAQKAVMDRILTLLTAKLPEKPAVKLRLFIADEKKEGGRIEVISGRLAKLDRFGRKMILKDGRSFGIDDIVEFLDPPQKIE